MSPRTLFIIVLRILGILVIKEIIYAIPQLVSTVISFFTDSPMLGFLMVIVSLLTFALYLWLAYTLVYKADRLVTKFALTENFSEPVLDLNFSTNTVLRIAIIVTGMVVLIDEVPEFCRLFYRTLQQREISILYSTTESDWSPLVSSGVKIILGLLLIGERKRILEMFYKTPNNLGEKIGIEKEDEKPLEQ
jgi:hypothetical protein